MISYICPICEKQLDHEICQTFKCSQEYRLSFDKNKIYNETRFFVNDTTKFVIHNSNKFCSFYVDESAVWSSSDVYHVFTKEKALLYLLLS